MIGLVYIYYVSTGISGVYRGYGNMGRSPTITYPVNIATDC